MDAVLRECLLLKTSSRRTVGSEFKKCSANISPLHAWCSWDSGVARKHPACVDPNRKIISWRDSLVDNLHTHKIYFKREKRVHVLGFPEENITLRFRLIS